VIDEFILNLSMNFTNIFNSLVIIDRFYQKIIWQSIYKI